MNNFNTIIIGAGQAGLAAAYYLNKQKRNFLVLEAGNLIGDVWANRYDSLRLFTSARYNNLPGSEFPGNKDHFPTKDEVAAYLRGYAESREFPVLLNQPVISLSKPEDLFLVKTEQETYLSKNVIIATGPFQRPLIPDFSRHIEPSVFQIHSSEYKNVQQLKQGSILVIGGGNSGVQIVEELAKTNRDIYFSFGGKLKQLPNNNLTQRLIFGSGITSASINSPIGKLLKRRGEPIMGTNIKRLFNKANVFLVGRTLSAVNNEIRCEKRTLDNVDNIIWSTGFRPDFGWISLDILNENGMPIQKRGVSNVSGLYFLGLAWMHSRNSGLLGGVKNDAAYVIRNLS